ncbi:cadmium-translocating P-type ATPase [Candidatus Nomurabacteria bacterium]|nr:cadmium-translocating P-type ATPase [Candidatus Nomurabacteria bacterium]
MEKEYQHKIFEEIEEEKQELKRDALLTSITLVGLVTGVYFQLTGAETIWWAIPYLAAYLAGGIPASIDAILALRNKALEIDLLMVLAALAAAGVGEVRDGAILLFLFSLAGTLEGYAMGNTKRAVAALMKLRPDEANLLNPDGTTTRVAVETLKIGDKVIVRPGERMPIDGVIEEGIGAVDQSSVTGESVPVDKEPGDEVFGATVNQNSVLTIRATKTVEESTIARMIKLVTEAQEKRSPSEQFSEWFGQRYTFVVLFGSIAALGAFLFLGFPTDEALYKAATLLVVASPCAIVISVPAAILSAIAAAARRGVLFKGGGALESFGSIKTIAFDKTGTLTNGKMTVTDVVTVSDKTTDEIVKLVASLENHSDHPLALSIVKYANEQNQSLIESTKNEAVPGRGITAEIDGKSYWAGNRALILHRGLEVSDDLENVLASFETVGKTTVIVGDENGPLGIVAIADTIRDTALKALEALKKQGVNNFVMLTGDTQLVANAVGAQLSLPPESIYGALLPEDKVRLVEELTENKDTAFVGDGVNDAAALAIAQVGVAMGAGGSDVAIEAADVALLSDDLVKLADTHRLAQKANAIIKQNLYFATGIMLLMIIVTIFGDLPLPLGVVGHEGGTLLVVLNGLRLLFTKA